MPRSQYEGVRKIVTYNWTFYVVALVSIFVLAAFRFTWLAFAAALWTAVTLAVSHYIYDRSALYTLSWLKLRPAAWCNIHAGLDETTELLQDVIGRPARVFDVFDPEQMTEPSIDRARKLNVSARAEAVSWCSLPCDAASFDAAFVFFCAHEFRRVEARHTFLTEVARIIRPGGAVVVIEHLRDIPNGLAYGPGFFHFLSRSTWLKAFSFAQLNISREYSITPFVHVFELSRA